MLFDFILSLPATTCILHLVDGVDGRPSFALGIGSPPPCAWSPSRLASQVLAKGRACTRFMATAHPETPT